MPRAIIRKYNRRCSHNSSSDDSNSSSNSKIKVVKVPVVRRHSKTTIIAATDFNILEEIVLLFCVLVRLTNKKTQFKNITK